jgi:uncharacterized protein YegL
MYVSRLTLIATLLALAFVGCDDDGSPLSKVDEGDGPPASEPGGDAPPAPRQPPAEAPDTPTPTDTPPPAPTDRADVRLDDVWGEGVEIDVEELRWAAEGELLFRVGLTDPATGEPVAADARHFRFAEDDVPLGAEALFDVQRAKDLRVVLVLDLSRSILEADALEPLRAAARTLVESLPREARVSIVGFATDHDLLVDFTADAAEVLDVIDRLRPADGTAGRFTNLWGAVRFAADHLTTEREGSRAIVVFSDGRDNVAEADLSTALDVVDLVEATVYAVGLGADVDTDGLARLAGGDRVTMTSDPAALAEVFGDIGSRLGEWLTVTYVTPKRRGRHTLDVKIEVERGAAGFRASFSLP